jgi:acetolactate synthase I/II/III large subunit
LAADTTQMGYYSRSFYPVYAPRAYFTCSRLWTLGAAFPLAMGAAVAQPERPSVALIGDGGFLYHAQELATAVKYDIPVIVALFNDHAYGNVLRAQQEEFDGHVIGTRLHNPDFIQLAASYGVWARRVQDAPALESALREAIAAKKPALIEMPVGPMQRIF